MKPTNWKSRGGFSPSIFRRSENESTDSAINVYAVNDIDAEQADVKKIIFTLADLVDGYVYDCINGTWMLSN